MPRRHDADAGGDAALLAAKAQLRDEVWSALRVCTRAVVLSDLELALAAEAGLIDPSTVVVTTVHELQVRAPGEIPTAGHDIHVDLVVTPERLIECSRPRGYEPPRLRWQELTGEKISSIPLLQRLR